MFSRFFVDRPIFASVVSLIIVIAGLVSMLSLSVEQYPTLTPPSIIVKATYRGASPEVVSETVQAPIEDAINGVENMIYLASVASGSGSSTTNVFFKVGTDPQEAMINVNNRIQATISTLPETVQKYGVEVRKAATSILMLISLYSDDERYNATYLANYALLNMVDELKRVEGVGDVQIMGGEEYAIRIWLKPDKLAKFEISTSEIAAAVSSQNLQRAAGGVGKRPLDVKVDRDYMIVAPGRFSTVEQFENIILRANSDGTALRLKDVADVELGSQVYEVVARSGTKISLPVMVSLAPGANSLETTQRVYKQLEKIEKNMPRGIGYLINFETSRFVQNSINQVVRTLLEAFVLVFLVVLLFLKRFSATVIPCIAVPVSVIGSFAGMKMLGFSINTLTLFGLVLAIGIVVDDAIVVIENVERIMRTEKLSAREATIKAMGEVSGALVAIVLVLCAVFVPVSFMGGLAGTMYKQFAITIAVSVVISGICALTLSPALCAIFLGKKSAFSDKIANNPLFLSFDKFFEWLTEKYTYAVQFTVKNIKVTVASMLAIFGFTYLLFLLTPSSLVPDEDQGVFMASVVLDPGASLDRTTETAAEVASKIGQSPLIDVYTFIAGYSVLSSCTASNGASMYFVLKDWSERTRPDQTAKALVARAFGIGAGIIDGRVIAFCPPPIIGMSTTGGFEGYIQQTGNMDVKAMQDVVNKFVAAAAKCPELRNVYSNFNAATPRLDMKVDTLKAMSMGVSVDEIYNTVASTFGSYYINDFSQSGRGFKVMMQAKGEYRAYPDQIKEIYVRSKSGSMIPLSAFVKLTPTAGPDLLERFNLFPAAKVMGDPAPGYTSGEALDAMERLAKQVLPSDYQLSWSGSSYQERQSGGTAGFALAIGLLIVFLILAALYERWTLPFAVMFAVPFGMLGAVGFVLLRNFSNDIYFQIALITLVGLSAKNAILIIEFAAMLRHEGMSLIESAIKAANLRFRPIVMTSLAFILGCLPLAISTGVGHASRNSLGTAVVGGMITATILVPIFIPLMYVLISKLGDSFNKSGPQSA